MSFAVIRSYYISDFGVSGEPNPPDARRRRRRRPGTPRAAPFLEHGVDHVETFSRLSFNRNR
jgi:hypothetical protein